MLCFVLFVMCIVGVIGDHIVEAYSRIGIVTTLYVENNVSLCLVRLVEETTLRMGIVLDVLAAVPSRCLL